MNQVFIRYILLAPPFYYSTWLGINDRGNAANLLFFMGPNTNRPKNRGTIVSEYVLNNDLDPEVYLEKLSDERSQYGLFNYVQLVMSPQTGLYSLYYVNNNDTNASYTKMNNDAESQFIFSLSNSDPERPFQKVVNGEIIFKEILETYTLNSNKTEMIDSLLALLQNKTENMPDKTLAAFMNTKDESAVNGVSRVKNNEEKYFKSLN